MAEYYNCDTIITEDGQEQINKTVADLKEANKSDAQLVGKITTGMCTRPSFFFLYETIITMLAAHNYHVYILADMETLGELNPDMNTYFERAFLERIIAAVAYDFPAVTNLGIDTNKILAGKECVSVCQCVCVHAVCVCVCVRVSVRVSV